MTSTRTTTTARTSTTARTTHKPKTRTSPDKATALSLALRSVSLTDAVAAFDHLNTAFHVLPDHEHITITNQLRKLAAEATTHHPTVDALTQRSSTALRQLTGLAPTEFHNPANARTIHTTRNLLLALCLANPATPTICPPASASAPNPDALNRATTYALTEAGLTPGETSHVTLEDLTWDDNTLTVTVYANAGGTTTDHHVPLDAFATAAVIATAASLTGRAHTTELVYNPTKDRTHPSAPTAAQQGKLDRLRTWTGLNSDDTSATSICRWRHQNTYEHYGIDQATALAGKREGLLAKQLTHPNATTDPNSHPAQPTGWLSA